MAFVKDSSVFVAVTFWKQIQRIHSLFKGRGQLVKKSVCITKKYGVRDLKMY